MNAMAAIPEETARDRLLVLAGKHLSKCGGVPEAADALMAAIKNKPDLRAALLGY